MNKNRELHELLRHCWHEPYGEKLFRSSTFFTCYKCGMIDVRQDWNSDYAADSRLVLKEMMKRKDWLRFKKYINKDSYDHLICISIDLILDTTGKLRDLAIDWLKETKDDSSY